MRLQQEPATAAEVHSHRSGTQYHLLARTAAHRWWRPLVVLVLLIVFATMCCALVYGVVTGLATAVGVVTDPVLGSADPLWTFVVAFASVAGLLPAVLLTARVAQRRPMGTLSSVEGRLRWRWMLDCVRWALLCQVLVIGSVLALGDRWDVSAWPGWRTYLTMLALAVVVVPFQAAAEEYLCRGLLVQTFASWTRTPWPGALAGSILFVALHDYTDPLAVVDLFVFAITLCWLSIRTGGLEAAIALHMVNNVAAIAVGTTQGLPTLDQSGTFSLWDVLPTITTTVAYAWWIDRRARRLGITLTAPFQA